MAEFTTLEVQSRWPDALFWPSPVLNTYIHFIFQIKSLNRSRSGFSEQRACHTSMRTWVQITQTHAKLGMMAHVCNPNVGGGGNGGRCYTDRHIPETCSLACVAKLESFRFSKGTNSKNKVEGRRGQNLMSSEQHKYTETHIHTPSLSCSVGHPLPTRGFNSVQWSFGKYSFSKKWSILKRQHQSIFCYIHLSVRKLSSAVMGTCFLKPSFPFKNATLLTGKMDVSFRGRVTVYYDIYKPDNHNFSISSSIK